MKSVAFVILGLTLLAHSPALYSQQIFVLAAFDHSPDMAAAQVFSEAGFTLSWRPGNHSTPYLSRADRLRSVSRRLPTGTECNVLGSGRPDGVEWSLKAEEMAPLINADCDRVAAMVWQGRRTLPLPLVVRAFGRALGRVMAHELYHYVTQSATHNESNLVGHAMTFRDLILPEVSFEPAEVEALRKAMSARDPATQASGRSVTE